MSLDRIEITPFATIVGDILQGRRTGYLSIIHPPVRKTLYWSQGELVLITSATPEDSLGEFLVRRGIVSADRAFEMLTEDPDDVVSKFHEAGLLELSWRQTLLREWTHSLFVPLFALDEGTAAFTDDEAIEPEKRVFLQSTPALVLEGIRVISNGLVVRRSLGDLKREIGVSRNSRHSLDTLPLTEAERRIASQLTEPRSIQTFLKQFPSESLTAAKVVIGLLTVGLFEIVELQTAAPAPENFDDLQRDLELMAAIGSSDPKALRIINLARQLPKMDHYQFLDLPRAATRTQIISQAELLKRMYDPATLSPLLKDSIMAIHRRADEAMSILKDAVRRAAYDKLYQERQAGATDALMRQKMNQQEIAEQNFAKAKELSMTGDYYGAIVLLKQAVEFSPDRADAWFLLGSCEERNPKWRRKAAESFQRVLSIDPNHVEALVSLGDLYKSEGLISRAQTCWDDVLKIAPDNHHAKTRLASLGKK